MKKVATIIYAVGWTHHSFATQIIRAAAILQLLLGNVGRAGGGVNALRGHSNIQGATDMAGIFDMLPGYLKMPAAADAEFQGLPGRITPKAAKPGPWDSFNYWSNTPKFAVSFLKAMYGDAARKDNDWAFHYLPKIDRKYSWAEIWDDMYRGTIKGLFAFGMNGVAIGPNSQKNIDALKKADWLVVCEIYPDETSEFWKSPGITPDDMKQIPTTVYRLPGAGFAEKDGTFVNSARWLQWKNVALPPPGHARLDQEILARIFLKVRELYQKEGGKFPDPILQRHLELHRPAKPLALRNRPRDQRPRRHRHHRLQTESDHQGRPAVARLRLAARRWLHRQRQLDLLRLVDRSRPHDAAPRHRRSLRPRRLSQLGVVVAGQPPRALQPRLLRSRGQSLGPRPQTDLVERSPAALGRRRRSGFQSRFAAQGSHGPVHHESRRRRPHLRPARRLRRRTLPRTLRARREPHRQSAASRPIQESRGTRFNSTADKFGTPAEGYNIVCTTFRLTEHYHYWTKNNPMNVQLVPEPFVEIPAELADEMGLRGGENVKVSSARGHYIAKAMVTRRIKPMMIDGKKTYQIGIPIHWGYRGIAEDEGKTALTPANMLSPAAIDPNAYTPEFKGFLVKLEKLA